MELALRCFCVGGGERAFSGCPRLPKCGPAGLRWLLKSPPRHAGRDSAALRATRFNPCRRRHQFVHPFPFQFAAKFNALNYIYKLLKFPTTFTFANLPSWLYRRTFFSRYLMYVFLLWWPNTPARRTLFFTDLFVQVENEQVRFGKE